MKNGLGSTVALAAVAFAAWVSCKDNEAAEHPLVSRTERQLATLMIGPEGGSLNAGTVLVEIPPGALASPRTVTLTEVNDLGTVAELPAVTRIFDGRALVLGPPDLRFAKPATLTVTIAGDAGMTVAIDEGLLLYRAEQRTNQWRPAAVSWHNTPIRYSENPLPPIPDPKLIVTVDHAQDFVLTAVKSTCFDHISCDQSPVSCAVRSATADIVRCTVLETQRVACTCAGAAEPVASFVELPPSAAAYGAVAMLCGATCTTPQSCMPHVSCFGGSSGTTTSGAAPPPAGWSCFVSPSSAIVTAGSSAPGEAGLCLLGDNRPPVPDGPLVSCTCSQSGAYPQSLARTMPTNDEILKLWKENCASSCP